MAFPQTPLPIKVDVSLDGTTWTDVTNDVRAEQQVRISRGRSDWGQQVDAGRCSFALSNTDGTYSPRNPESPYYGQIGRNTPVRVSVETGSVAAWLPATSSLDSMTTPDAAALDITGDIDVRLDATLLNWYLADDELGSGATSILTELIGKFQTTGDQRSWVMYTENGYLKLWWSEDGTTGTDSIATSTEKLPVPASGRLAVRATLDVDNGSGGWTARFYTAASMDSTWVQLGDDVTGGATTSIFASAALLVIGSAINGTNYDMPLGYVHAAQVRDGINGTLVASPDFTAQTSGATSFADSAGRTWSTNGEAEITNRKVRFVGEVSSWTPEKNSAGNDVICKVEASGIMRRLGQGVIAAKSPMYREFTSPFRSNIVAYWPMEDGTGATQFASAFDGHPAVTYTGSVTPAAYSDWSASDALPTVGTGSMQVTVPPYTATNYLFLRVFVAVPEAGVVSTQRLLSLTQTGTATTWSVYLTTGGDLELRAYNDEGTQILATGTQTFGINGEKKSIGVELTQDGSDIDYTLFSYDITDSTLTSASAVAHTGTLTGYTVRRATQVRFGEDGAMNDTAIGHLAISDDVNGFGSTAGALIGWNGETAAARVHRLGIEEQFSAYSTAPGDEQMGVQARATVLELLRAAGEVDEGILCEQRDVLGVRLVQRASMYNQGAALVMDYTASDGLVTPLDPVDDDQSVTNDVTVAREGGSSARVTLDSGPLSTLAPPDGIGLYDTSVTLGLYDDEQPAHHAGWRLHAGTWDETRFPQVTVMLAAAPDSIEDASGVDVGSRVQITNPPVWLPPDTLDLLVQGYSEVLDQFTWTITYNCTPYGPFSVAWAGDDDTATLEREFSWADTEGSELAEDLTSTETDVDVLTTVYPTWTDSVFDTPLDWRVGGEVMTVTAPHSLVNSNPFFTSDATGWSGQNASVARSTTVVMPHPRAVASLLVTPDGSTGNANALGTGTAVGSITPGAQYVASMWVYSPGGYTDIHTGINWHNAANTYLSTGQGSTTAIAAGQWTYVSATLTAPASASRAVVLSIEADTPSAGDIYYVWGLRVTRIKSSWLYDTFTRTTASGWGTSDSGTAWSNVGGGSASDYLTSATYGAHVLSTVDVTRRSGVTAPSADFDIYCDITTSALATGDSLFGAVCTRMADASNLYMARLEFTTGNAISLSVRKVISGTQTVLGSAVTLRDTHVAGTFVRVRFQGSGTTLRAKAWVVGQLEPGPWQVDTTDSALTAAQQIGTRSIRVTGNTNAASVEIRYDNFEITNPQTFTVERSVNGVTKTHSAGADVRLAYPAYASL